jgi:hypothetical protein
MLYQVFTDNNIMYLKLVYNRHIYNIKQKFGYLFFSHEITSDVSHDVNINININVNVISLIIVIE